MDQLVRDVRPVVLGGVDVIDTERHGPAQHVERRRRGRAAARRRRGREAASRRSRCGGPDARRGGQWARSCGGNLSVATGSFAPIRVSNRNVSSGCSSHRIRTLRTTLVGARGPVPEPADRLRRELEPERGDPDPVAGTARDGIAAPVGRRDLLPRLRRAPLHDGRARRPFRAQGRAADRARALPVRRGARDRVERDVAADRQPRRDGRGGGVDHAVDAVDHHQHLPRVRTAEGDRDLGERHGRGGRPRTGRERLSPRALLVRVGVPRQHPDHPRGARRREVLGPQVAGSRGSESRPDRRHSLDHRDRRAGLRTDRGTREGLGSVATLAALGLAVVVLAGFVAWERTRASRCSTCTTSATRRSAREPAG